MRLGAVVRIPGAEELHRSLATRVKEKGRDLIGNTVEEKLLTRSNQSEVVVEVFRARGDSRWGQSRGEPSSNANVVKGNEARCFWGNAL